MNKLNTKDTKALARAIFNWRKSYQALETSPEVEKARLSVKRAEKRLIEAELPYRAEMKKEQETIIDLTTAVGSSVLAFGIRAKFRKAYIRVTYDREVLDRLAETNVRLRNLIMPHRKESQVKSGVSIEVADPIALLKPVKFAPVLEIK